jgi:hypothetical protein
MPDRSPARWRPHLKLMLAIGSVLVAIGLLTAFLATQQRSPGEATRVPPAAATPAPTATAPASPVAVAWPPGSLPALLSIAPDFLDDDPGLPIQATYADIAGWLDAQGHVAGTVDGESFREAIAPLPLPEPVRSGGLSAAWRDAYGFDLRQVDAVLAVGQAPNLVLIMTGRYDADALYATWVANGYQAVEIEETTVWSLAPGDRIDLSAPASQPSLGLLNTMVMLDDGTLVASSRPSLMAEALRVARGEGDSLASRAELRPALPRSVDAVAAILATGDIAAAPAAGNVPPSPTAELALPEIELVLFTVPTDGASVRVTLVLEEAPERPSALRRMVRDRVDADPWWSARWAVDEIGIAGDGTLIELTITGGPGREAMLDIADPRELGPFRWSVPD